MAGGTLQPCCPCPALSPRSPTCAAILFMWTVSAAYGSMGIVPQLVAERAVLLRERSDGLYTPATYLASGGGGGGSLLH